ncbi:MAG: hypothetical protein KF810_13525 [Rhizobiaceae bacterium]|nr:hypothetical protein [Rhizobiaceae bacterium]
MESLDRREFSATCREFFRDCSEVKRAGALCGLASRVLAVHQAADCRWQLELRHAIKAAIETLTQDFHGRAMYQLNQMEGALNALLSGKPSSARKRLGSPIPKALKTQIKRLLEIDRERARTRNDAGENDGVAFFDVLPDGKGSEAQYDAFGATCLAVGLQMLRFGFKQREVVGKMAAVRRSLREVHARLMKDVAVEGPTYDIHNAANLPRKRGGRNPDTNTADVSWFLVVDAVEDADGASPEGHGDRRHKTATCRGWEDLMRFLQQIIPHERPGVFVLEISEPMVRMSELLDAQPVRRRGRS